MTRIDNWSLRPGGGKYDSPEVGGLVVCGRVAAIGKYIRTSPVVAFRGRVVTTASGSRYRLGAIDPEYLRWSVANGRPIDPCRPLRRMPR